MWAATEFEFKNRHVSFHKPLNKATPFKDRVNTAIGWLKNGANFVMIYIDQPDRHGHGYGPNSAKVISSFISTLYSFYSTVNNYLFGISPIGTRND